MTWFFKKWPRTSVTDSFIQPLFPQDLFSKVTSKENLRKSNEYSSLISPPWTSEAREVKY